MFAAMQGDGVCGLKQLHTWTMLEGGNKWKKNNRTLVSSHLVSVSIFSGNVYVRVIFWEI